jgi:hypothetical protein
MNHFTVSRLFYFFAVVGTMSLTAVGQAQKTDDGRDSSDSKIEKYVVALIKAFDRNEDGDLQEDELSRMRRRPQGADLDKDGTVTKKELVEHFESRIRRAGSSKSRNGKQKKQMVTGIVSDSGFGGLLSSGIMSDSDENSDSDASEPLTIDAFMLRAEDDSPLEKLATNLRGKTAEDVEQMLRAVRRDEELECDYDTMQFTVNWNQKFRLTVGSQVPVVTSISSRRDGGTSSNTSNYSVGTTLSLLASNEAKDPTLYVDLNKASVFDSDTVLFESESGEETFAKSVAKVELTSEFAFEKDKANVVSMSDSGSIWVLIVVAR